MTSNISRIYNFFTLRNLLLSDKNFFSQQISKAAKRTFWEFTNIKLALREAHNGGKKSKRRNKFFKKYSRSHYRHIYTHSLKVSRSAGKQAKASQQTLNQLIRNFFYLLANICALEEEEKVKSSAERFEWKILMSFLLLFLVQK